jgi:hypothetical protein
MVLSRNLPSSDIVFLQFQSIRLSSLAVFGIIYFITIATFLNMAGLSSQRPVGLFTVWLIFDSACIIIYVLLQIVLVLNTLEDRWPLGDILFGFLFFIIGIIFQYILSTTICESAKHYIDGIFFVTIFTLLAVMMVYKYWDSITKEDLEFSVGGKANVWEIKVSRNVQLIFRFLLIERCTHFTGPAIE